MARLRLDAELVRRGLASSRTQAQQLVGAGKVTVSGMVASKVATQVDQACAIEVLADAEPTYVSRGAHKLVGALDAFAGLHPSIEGAKCLDAGASTGGFTDVLLQRGAAEVVAVDVGYGQLAWKLRSDPRVVAVERTNIRTLAPEVVGSPPSLVVADLSFISLTLVLENLVRCAPGATMILMVKPQFEVGKGKVGAKGVVREAALRTEAILKVARAAEEAGLQVGGVAPSPLPGPTGNVEYFLLLSPPGSAGALTGDALENAAEAAVANGPQDGIASPPKAGANRVEDREGSGAPVDSANQS